jgi:hypothetical protein
MAKSIIKASLITLGAILGGEVARQACDRGIARSRRKLRIHKAG